jgi:hypothetical protein
MGYLTENHRCPRGIFSRITDALSTLVIGALIGAVFYVAMVEKPVMSVTMAAAALGAVLAAGVRQAISGRPS